MKRLVMLCVSISLIILMIGCSSIQNGDSSHMTTTQIDQLRKEYPSFSMELAMASREEAVLETQMVTNSHIAIIEIIRKEKDTLIDLAAPGTIFYEEKMKHKALGYDPEPEAYYQAYPHYTIRVEKVLWENLPKAGDEKSSDWAIKNKRGTPIEEDKEYMTMGNIYQEQAYEILKPGTRLVMPMLWGYEDSIYENYITFSMNFAYYLTDDGYILSVSEDAECEAYTGWTLEDYLSDLQDRMDDYYKDPEAFHIKRYEELYGPMPEEFETYDPKDPLPTPSPTPQPDYSKYTDE